MTAPDEQMIERAAVRISERSSEYLHDYLSELPDKAWEAMTVALCEIAQEEIAAAHSVIAGKVAELEGALREAVRHLRYLASDEEHAAYKRGHAALAPYPERTK